MKSTDIRRHFLEYFAKSGHKIVPSSSLIPHNDPTLLFNNAGMNQFKDYFTQNKTPAFKTATTAQKCVRAGGKHNDLENVGFTPRHHTFFEMLGNFSFGDYFKEQAITSAYELLTQVYGLDPKKLLFTVHHSDTQAWDIWVKKIGISKDRIFFRSDKDNFWEMGDTGPCGPCSEIFYDHGEQYTKTGINPFTLDCPLDDEDRFVELWNLVFMQYEKYIDKNGVIQRRDLPAPSIDTGAGLERLSSALQKVYWNYDTDLFSPILQSISKISPFKLNDLQKRNSYYVLADHLRSSVMLISDGVIPSNEGRGHVLRRIIRRGIRHGKLLDLPSSFLSTLAPSVFEVLGQFYPENAANIGMVQQFLEIEEKQFCTTLDTGLVYLQNALKNELVGNILPGTVAFKLHDTYGFPIDLTQSILKEQNLLVDEVGFDKAVQEQKILSQKSWKGQTKWDEANNAELIELHNRVGDTIFEGYSKLETTSELVGLYDNLAIFDSTPFYAQSGGQAGDIGEIIGAAQITDTQKLNGNLIAHHYVLNNSQQPLVIGKKYQLKVNSSNRASLAAHHSATHLLQSALIAVLGKHVKQAGSVVQSDKLRFDFTHFSAMTKEQIQAVEKHVNNSIRSNFPVETIETQKDKALALGACAFFGEKYGEIVRVVKMANESIEFCGGTHVQSTSNIQLFVIIKEESLAKGVRRIEAKASIAAYEYLSERSSIVKELENQLNSPSDLIVQKVIDLKTKLKELGKSSLITGTSLLPNDVDTTGSQIVYQSAQQNDQKLFAQWADEWLSKNPQLIIFIYHLDSQKDSQAQKISFLLKTHKTNSKFNCQEFFKQHSSLLNAKGGGRFDMVMGNGSGDKKNIEDFCAKFS